MCVYLQFDSLARKDAFVSTVNVSGPALAPVTLATVAVLPNAPTYAGELLTQTGAAANLLVDATGVSIGDRILVKNQADARQNGVYVVLTDLPWQLQRSPDFNQLGVPYVAGTTVTVTSGPTNTGTAWSLTGKAVQIDPLQDTVTFAQITWLPNPSQTPTNYKVEYKNFNTVVNQITREWREHCKRTVDPVSYYVDSCVVCVPGGAYVNRPNADGTTSRVYLTEEPYVYVEVCPTDYAEGNRFTTNNESGYKASFIVYTDKFIVGTNDVPPAAPDYTPPALNSGLKWFHFKSCMRTNMRLDIKSTQWVVRLYDRFGHDIVVEEDPASMPVVVTATPPPVNPAKQTSILLGITPLAFDYKFDTANNKGAGNC